MKTKHYLILTGLLMATCITNYGQEIVNEFTFQKTDMNFYACNLFENEDGTFLFRTYMCTPNTYENLQHYFLKTTPDGEVLDSLSIPYEGTWSFLLRNPTATDSYILTYVSWTFNETNSLYTAIFHMFFIDADLNINNEITIPLVTLTSSNFQVDWDPLFINPQNDFIISFWINDVLHLMCIGLDGTIKTVRETTELFAPNYETQPPQPNGDSTLIYSEMGFGIFSESPLTYYKLGGYYPSSGPWPIIGYFFDANFDLIETRLFDQYDEDIAFDGRNSEHILPFDEGTYVLTTQITKTPQNNSGIGLAKYDMNHDPIEISPLFGNNYCYPLQTEIADDNTIYQLYVKDSQNKLSLARLDDNLNLNWDIALPINHMLGTTGTCMTILKNGNIVLGGICRKSNRYCASFVTLHDSYDTTPESVTVACPFSLYPNPVKDQLNLNFAEGTEPESVNLFDLQGRLVGAKCNDLESFDMSGLSAGVYMLRITMKDGASYYEKVIKE